MRGTHLVTRLLALLRRTARWAWERDEVGQTITRQRILFTSVMYVGLFALSLVAGVVLWLDGRVLAAATVWIVGNGIAGFFGIIEIGWDVLEYLDENRSSGVEEPADRGPERELAPELGLSQDSKISFLIAVTLLAVLTATVLLAEALA